MGHVIAGEPVSVAGTWGKKHEAAWQVGVVWSGQASQVRSGTAWSAATAAVRLTAILQGALVLCCWTDTDGVALHLKPVPLLPGQSACELL